MQMSARELAEWRIVDDFQREVERLVGDKVPVNVAAEIVFAAGEERDDDGGVS